MPYAINKTNMATDASERPRPGAKRWLRFSLAGLLFAVLCWAGLLFGVHLGRNRPVLSPDPLQITIVQRGVQEIPGLQGQAKVRIDDVTRGQVMLSIADGADQPLLLPQSVRPGEVVTFTVGGQPYYLRVRQLKNELLGEDFGVFEVSSQDRWTSPAAVPGPTVPTPAPPAGGNNDPF